MKRLQLDGALVTAYTGDILVKQGDTDSDVFFVVRAVMLAHHNMLITWQVEGKVMMTVTDHSKRQCSLYEARGMLLRNRLHHHGVAGATWADIWGAVGAQRHWVVLRGQGQHRDGRCVPAATRQVHQVCCDVRCVM